MDNYYLNFPCLTVALSPFNSNSLINTTCQYFAKCLLILALAQQFPLRILVQPFPLSETLSVVGISARLCKSSLNPGLNSVTPAQRGPWSSSHSPHVNPSGPWNPPCLIAGVLREAVSPLEETPPKAVSYNLHWANESRLCTQPPLAGRWRCIRNLEPMPRSGRGLG